MRTQRSTTPAALRVTAAAFGALMLTAAGAAAANAADPVGHGNDAVDVNVAISELTEPGVLAMSVAGDAVSLTEGTSADPLLREFTGTLPTVTVTDTRTAEEIPDGAAWYVLGSASQFTDDAGQAPISAGHLGWKPALIDGGDSGLVAEGGEVVTVVDDPTTPPTAPPNNVGLVDQELLAMAFDSEDVASEGSWTANANLFLRTPSTTAAGNYTSTLTLSLFE
ncbi:hypothetical protein ACFWN7_06275 [Agromyces sp. NPDC058484]|uniref:hypothetical protein n=1 Tax=Agromyces sp. NPDC058484 TaxID=3346524 RepID=UPI0036494DE3